ncbi:putative two-component system response regulator [Gammaproteobacteria bacterium]
MNDDLLLLDDTPDLASSPYAAWQVLVVDDEPEVHQVTHLVLKGLRYQNRDIEFVNAYSAREAAALLSSHPDIALVLLDVVMETEDAGLMLVRQIRDQMNNRTVRIVLRTGQPGHAPEQEVILQYDINDYKSKSELTAQKLFTTVIAALRSYQDIRSLEVAQMGMAQMMTSSNALFRIKSLAHFSTELLEQYQMLLALGQSSPALLRGAMVLPMTGDSTPVVLIAQGSLSGWAGCALDALPPDIRTRIETCIRQTGNQIEPNLLIFYLATHHGPMLVYLERFTGFELSPLQGQLLCLFNQKAALALDNVQLFQRQNRAQEAAILALARVAEFKDDDTGNHLLRIETRTQALAERLVNHPDFGSEIDEIFLSQIGAASILHDIGKVAIPDEILMKPGMLTPEEWTVMRTHPQVGADILREAAKRVGGRNYLELASQIANYHHERFNGTGYPAGLAGDAIPIAARMVAVVDVYDALTSHRPYKAAWSRAKAIEAIRESRGSHFDPRIVDAFLELLEENRALTTSIIPGNPGNPGNRLTP